MRRGAEEKGLREAQGSADNVFAVRQRSDMCGKVTEKRDAATDQVRRVCQYCGKGHQWGAEHCPAFGKRCSRCMGKNYFAKVCKKKVMRAHEVLSEEVPHEQTQHPGCPTYWPSLSLTYETQSNFVIGTAEVNNVGKFGVTVNLVLRDQEVRFQLYSGSL